MGDRFIKHFFTIPDNTNICDKNIGFVENW